MARRPNPYLIDDDNPALGDAELAAMRPAGEVLPPDVYAALTAAEPTRRPGQRGPGRRPAKVAVTLRLDPAAIAAWRGSGDGWQSRINDLVVREAPTAKRRA